ncbi:MAG TPA: HemK/PrmC family methyltransferase [Gemmatimonadales bacterium]|nr:HemK/PrmC family methyltransferase [Gemmatimonadales bacterium]
MPERVARRSSIAAALDEAVAQLADAGVSDPRREATTLWAAVAGPAVTAGDVWLARDRDPAPEVTGRFRDAVARRSSGIPFAYAVRRASFRSLDLLLDPRALIPRPETEGLVDVVLQWARARPADRRRAGGRSRDGVVADIGTGCGCIALSLAVEGDFERVIAVERSREAAALARDNVERVGPPVPVEVREGDGLSPLAAGALCAIVSNPPYLSDAEYERLDSAVRLFEPREALAGGPDGLGPTRALLAGGRARLAPGGIMALEIDERRADETRALAREHGWAGAVVYEDLFGRPRYLLAHA